MQRGGRRKRKHENRDIQERRGRGGELRQGGRVEGRMRTGKNDGTGGPEKMETDKVERKLGSVPFVYIHFGCSVAA